MVFPENPSTSHPLKQTYLAALGRIAPEKSMDRAIRIAQRCGIR